MILRSTGTVFTKSFVILGLLAAAGCAQRLGAPGQAPALQTIQMKGESRPVAECTMAAMQAADDCDSMDFGLGITTNEATKDVHLTCYNVQPTAAAVGGAAFGIIGALIGYAVGEKEVTDETNKRPPAYTAVLRQSEPGKLDVSFWVATSIDGPDYYIGKMKTAFNSCDGKMAAPAVVPAPVLAPAPANPPATEIKQPAG